ncbi:hypothetical protein SLA2020_318550 [Shorea laevis]
MGSLETGLALKRDNLFRSSSAVAVFLFFVVLFQMFLPGSVVEKSGASFAEDVEVSYGDFKLLKEMGVFEFGEDVRFEPTKLLEKFQREAREANLYSSAFNRTLQRFGYRKPQLALVFADLLVDSQKLLMVTVAAALQEIGYEIQVYSLEDGPVHDVWRKIGIPVTVIQPCDKTEIVVDWLSYDGILVSSFEAKGIFSW